MPASTSWRSASRWWRRNKPLATDFHGSTISFFSVFIRADPWLNGFPHMSGRLTRRALQLLDAAAARLLPKTQRAAHLVTGSKGEEEVYFYLRQRGYVMVARNWRSPRRRSEIDLIGWDGDCLCFVEVKTRAENTLVPAEVAVDQEKRDDLRGVAREYLRRVPGRPATRFDVVSVYYGPEAGAPSITLFKNAFTLS